MIVSLTAQNTSLMFSVSGRRSNSMQNIPKQQQHKQRVLVNQTQTTTHFDSPALQQSKRHAPKNDPKKHTKRQATKQRASGESTYRWRMWNGNKLSFPSRDSSLQTFAEWILAQRSRPAGVLRNGGKGKMCRDWLTSWWKYGWRAPSPGLLREYTSMVAKLCLAG